MRPATIRFLRVVGRVLDLALIVGIVVALLRGGTWDTSLASLFALLLASSCFQRALQNLTSFRRARPASSMVAGAVRVAASLAILGSVATVALVIAFMMGKIVSFPAPLVVLVAILGMINTGLSLALPDELRPSVA